MPTNAELLETLHNWHLWSGADTSAREAEAEGRYASAGEYRARRDQRAVDPIQVLSATYDLIQSLTAGRWDTITEARLRGATWDQVAMALNQPADEIRNEYTAMVDWVATNRPDFVDLPRYCAAL